MTTTWCGINHRDYIYIQGIYHILCTQKRHPILHSHEWVNSVVFIRDSSENIDHAMKRLDITIRFTSFSLSWIWFCYGALPSAGVQGLALLTLSWDKNWDSHSLVNGYPSFYPRIALVAPSPEVLALTSLCEARNVIYIYISNNGHYLPLMPLILG